MKKKRLSIAPVATIALLLMVLFGWKTFTLNSQAWGMWAGFGHDPFGALLSGHPHGLRYLVYYPIFALAQYANLQPELIFGYACILMFFAIGRLIDHIDLDVWNTQGHALRRDLVVFCMFGLCLLMNGRLLFVFCGYLLIIAAGIGWLKIWVWRASNAICVLLGCLLAGLSSGTLLVAMALSASIIIISVFMKPRFSKNILVAIASITLILSLFAGPALIGINKNLAYYGGDDAAVVRMLGHGAGGEIVKSVGLSDQIHEDGSPASEGMLGSIIPYWWIAVILAAVVARYYGWRPIRMVRTSSPAQNLILLSIILAMVGGLFGYSVLMMAVIPFLMFFAEHIRLSIPRPSAYYVC